MHAQNSKLSPGVTTSTWLSQDDKEWAERICLSDVISETPHVEGLKGTTISKALNPQQPASGNRPQTSSIPFAKSKQGPKQLKRDIHHTVKTSIRFRPVLPTQSTAFVVSHPRGNFREPAVKFNTTLVYERGLVQIVVGNVKLFNVATEVRIYTPKSRRF
ncbi:hypothetical protein BDD12DRAFT_800583 [Trichophaea hybrida]|nr:hypothetical protein BDD12DRAFT_800583 [Trichophaea hybrida]